MRIIYKLDEEDIKKIMADHFEALPGEVKIENLHYDDQDHVRIQIDTLVE